jgi:hypothetical protein
MHILSLARTVADGAPASAAAERLRTSVAADPVAARSAYHHSFLLARGARVADDRDGYDGAAAALAAAARGIVELSAARAAA